MPKINNMSPKEYRDALLRLGWSSHSTSASNLGVSLSMSYRYASGRSPVSFTVARLLRSLIRLGEFGEC